MDSDSPDVCRRLQVVFKAIMKELDSVIHPNDVRKIRYDGKVLDHAVLRGINVFITAYFVVFGLSVLLVSVDNFGLETNFSAVAATLNNIGPGLGGVGPASNFSGYGAFSTCVLIFDMIAGRLEILPVLILLSPHTWVEGPVLRGKRVRRSREVENDLMMCGSLEMELG